MLSVILYGRNDSHGYNLHKRAAISLNAIAHLLSDPADEILFVDYNTPDDLPTFPEAIADTLTAKAIEKLRILRVRPAIHNERFAAKTHLVALEPIARNVAIRRTNPANKWVLSTNTDMIFVPRHEGQDLTAAIGGLKDGFYHLPRFELPEGLWETLDRKDPVGLIEGAKEWGERFHLNEIILSGNDNIYDGPGDFQLFLRDDLFKIGGFHEEMIRGWHLDANVARRMRMLRGEVSTALPALIGYHCDHTRQATAYHKSDRVENSSVLFVEDVFEPQIRGQMASWGMPEVEIEELRLGEASGARYLRGLEATISDRLEGFLQAEYVPEAYGRLSYEPAHVLPYLLDLVSCIPSDARIGYVGARRDMFASFSKAWAAMGGSEPIRVPDSAPWLAEAGGVAQPLQQWLDETDLFIFEVGAEEGHDQAMLRDAERARLWAVDSGFKAAAQRDRERQLTGAAPRRALVINGVHNFFEPQVFAGVSVTLTPFSSRIRHGYLIDPARAAGAQADQAARQAGIRAGRINPFTKAEIGELRSLTATLAADPDSDAWTVAARIATDIEAAAAAGVAGLFEDGSGAPVEPLLERLGASRASRTLESLAPLVAADAGAGAASRLIRLEDWEDPEWTRVGRWLFEARLHDILTRRRRWGWERITLAQNLLAELPFGTRPKVLLLADQPDSFAFALAGMGCQVDLVSSKGLAEGDLETEDWRRQFDPDGWMPAFPIGLASERAPDHRYDALVAVQNGLFAYGADNFGAVMQAAVARLRPGAHIGLSATAQLIEDPKRPNRQAIHHGLLEDGRIAQVFATLVDLPTTGQIDLRITPATLDRMADEEFPEQGPPALAVGDADRLETSAVLSLIKGPAADTGDWIGLQSVIASGSYSGAAPIKRPAPSAKTPETPAKEAARLQGGRYFTASDVVTLAPQKGRRSPAHFGPIFDRLKPLNNVRMTPMSLRVPMDLGEELAALADVGELERGGYALSIEARISNVTGPGPVLAIGVVGGGRLVAEHAAAADGAEILRTVLTFDIDEALAKTPDGLRLGLKGMGIADVEILEVVLR